MQRVPSSPCLNVMTPAVSPFCVIQVGRSGNTCQWCRETCTLRIKQMVEHYPQKHPWAQKNHLLATCSSQPMTSSHLFCLISKGPHWWFLSHLLVSNCVHVLPLTVQTSFRFFPLVKEVSQVAWAPQHPLHDESAKIKTCQYAFGRLEASQLPLI
jgi:hypothetical protein